jgi:phosphoribosylglycinamide formyltransferase-1
MSQTPLPIAVLISGSGTNLQALIDASEADGFGCALSVVISDRPGASGLARAERAGIPAVVVDWATSASREEFTTSICDAAEGFGVKAMVLAGFMRILAPTAIERFPDAIINVHPALLPAFPGAHAVEQALDHGVAVTGVTVHFVDEQVDHGPIITQEAVPVLTGDNAESLHARIQVVEHALLPAVVSAFGRREITVDGRVVRWDARVVV